MLRSPPWFQGEARAGGGAAGGGGGGGESENKYNQALPPSYHGDYTPPFSQLSSDHQILFADPVSFSGSGYPANMGRYPGYPENIGATKPEYPGQLGEFSSRNQLTQSPWQASMISHFITELVKESQTSRRECQHSELPGLQVCMTACFMISQPLINITPPR